jgi:deoxycytidine triphosphate deaminase
MALRGNDIIKRVLIDKLDEKRVRRVSYEIAVGQITDPKQGSVTGRFNIPGQGGMVLVISSEILHVPKDLVGYASVKTSLSQRGLLALNIGIVDPGWEGPLSAVLVNFGKIDFEIAPGDAFLRLTFQPLEGDEDKTWDAKWSKDEPGPWNQARKKDYYGPRHDSAVARLGTSFMDVHTLIDKSTNAKLKEQGLQFLSWFVPVIAVVAFLLTLATFVLNFVGPWRAPAVTERAIRQQVEAIADDVIRQRSAAILPVVAPPQSPTTPAVGLPPGVVSPPSPTRPPPKGSRRSPDGRPTP